MHIASRRHTGDVGLTPAVPAPDPLARAAVVQQFVGGRGSARRRPTGAGRACSRCPRGGLVGDPLAGAAEHHLVRRAPVGEQVRGRRRPSAATSSLAAGGAAFPDPQQRARRLTAMIALVGASATRPSGARALPVSRAARGECTASR